MSQQDTIVETPPGEFVCRIPHALVGPDEITLCAGIKFELVDKGTVELVLLTEADVERLTSPEGSA